MADNGGETVNGTVALIHEHDIRRGITGALDGAGDLRPLFSGKHVVIKPNDTWASPEDSTACTQADTVREVIRYVRDFAPSHITVSGGSGAGRTDEIFHVLGIDRVIREEEVEFFDHNRGPFVAVDLDYGPERHVMVNPHILEYETLVSVAQLKVHDAATVTLTMKNIAMSFPAADFYGHPRDSFLRPHAFFEDLHAFIAGMCKRFPPDLGLIVGHPAMTGRGPIGGAVFEADLYIAGTDFVACDSVGAYLLEKERVRHIEIANEMGLGTAEIDSIPIVGIPPGEALDIFRHRALTAGCIAR